MQKPGVNLINILLAAFMLVGPKSAKQICQLDWILTLLGATGVKSVHKYVGEIEPRCVNAPLEAIQIKRDIVG